MSTTTQTPVRYSQTANPNNKENTDLHASRYRTYIDPEELKIRDDETPEQFLTRQQKYVDNRREEFKEFYKTFDWRANKHMHLSEDMKTTKVVMDPLIQRFMFNFQTAVVDSPYNKFGKVAESWEDYTLMFRNGFNAGRDERKPITEEFQVYLEKVYCPVLWTLLYGLAGWKIVKRFYSQFKSCTIKVCAGTGFYGDNVFHMHIDGKIGYRQLNNHKQRTMNRLLFSVVRDAVSDEALEKESGIDDSKLDSDVYEDDSVIRRSVEKVQADQKQYGATCYPIWQPTKGFKSNHEFHKYMQKYYNEVGLLNSGLPRPHYELPEELMYRAKSGEVLIHKSHADKEGPQEVHSEPNPCPDRHFWAFDWTNVLHGLDPETGKQIKAEPVPVDYISETMQCLSDCRGKEYLNRMTEVKHVVHRLLDGKSGLESEDSEDLGVESCEESLKDIIPVGEGTLILNNLMTLVDKELGRFDELLNLRKKLGETLLE